MKVRIESATVSDLGGMYEMTRLWVDDRVLMDGYYLPEELSDEDEESFDGGRTGHYWWVEDMIEKLCKELGAEVAYEEKKYDSVDDYEAAAE